VNLLPEPVDDASQVGNIRKFSVSLEAEKSTTKAQAPRTSKAHLDYWRSRVFKPKFKRDGKMHWSANWAVQIRHQGKGLRWSLSTPNREAAATLAQQIYVYLLANGWEATLAKFRPKPSSPEKPVTIGLLLQSLRRNIRCRPHNLHRLRPGAAQDRRRFFQYSSRQTSASIRVTATGSGWRRLRRSPWTNSRRNRSEIGSDPTLQRQSKTRFPSAQPK